MNVGMGGFSNICFASYSVFIVDHESVPLWDLRRERRGVFHLLGQPLLSICLKWLALQKVCCRSAREACWCWVGEELCLD